MTTERGDRVHLSPEDYQRLRELRALNPAASSVVTLRQEGHFPSRTHIANDAGRRSSIR